VLNCSGLSTFAFDISSLRTDSQSKTLMLRLDYEPNKCIFAPQDILIHNATDLVEVVFNKTCCNLFTNGLTEEVRIVATVREAYLLFGFPVGRKFLEWLIKGIILVVGAVLLYILFCGEDGLGKIEAETSADKKKK
jgi:hypothetical protein